MMVIETKRQQSHSGLLPLLFLPVYSAVPFTSFTPETVEQ